MPLSLTTCDSPAQVEAIRQFLLRSHEVLNCLHNWDPRRWEGYNFHRDDAGILEVAERNAREVPMAFRSERLAGFAVAEYPGGVHLQVIPDDAPVQEALLTWCEKHLRQPKADGGSWLEVHCLDTDLIRKQILRHHGFAPLPEYERIRSRNMQVRVPQHALPTGYKLSTASEKHGKEMAALLNAAFDRTTHSAAEWKNFATLSPSFRSDLQIVVIAPDGSFAATAGFTMHADESFAVIEPVCTHPGHTNRGLAQAALSEGLKRLQNYGIEKAYVGAWHSNPISNHVYETMGFADPKHLRIWRREFVD